MPQMSPMNWILLFIFFLMIYMLINMLNFYIFMPLSKSSKKKMFLTKFINWKW